MTHRLALTFKWFHYTALRYITRLYEATNVGIGCKAIAQKFSDVAAELRVRRVLIKNSKMYCCGSQWPSTGYRNTLRRLFVFIIIIQHNCSTFDTECNAVSEGTHFFYVHRNVHRNSLSINVQQDATIHSLFCL